VVRSAISGTKAVYPPPRPQWIEDRFWVWVHYVAVKIARGELFEAIDALEFVRARLLGPLILSEAGGPPTAVRRAAQTAPERVEALAHERAQRRLVHAPGQVTLAELELEAQLRGMRGAALAHLLELDEGLLELFAVGADHVEDERVVDGAGEAFGRAALADLRLDHPHHVGGARVLLLDRLRLRVV